MKVVSIIFAVILFCNSSYGQSKKNNDRPNILLILADDLTFSDLAPYGSKQVYTPNIAELAEEGMCFDNMYTATAMCAPTRQQLLTGLYPVRNGAYPNHSVVYDGTLSVAHHLQKLGYNTAQIGKRHYGPQSSFPFDYLGGRDSDNGKGQDIELAKAEDYIKKSKDNPFFLMVASNQPHTPWNRGDASRYPPSEIKLPDNFVDTKITRAGMSRYFAEITYLDSLVGVCLEMIDRSGQRENTIVIFTTEQGSSFPFAKWTCYDQGLKTGFIVRWPGKVKPSTRTDVMTQYVDVIPTLIDIAGGEPEKINTGSKDAYGKTGFDGKSLKKVLTGEVKSFRDYVFGVQTTRGIIKGSDAYGIRSSRNKRYLYIHNINYQNSFSNVLLDGQMFKQWKGEDSTGRASFYEVRPEEELYDMEKDPYQLVNLADERSLSPVKQELKGALASFMKQQGDLGIETEMRAITRQPKSTKN